jgi:uncharacterized protein (TIGR02646 family)
MIAITRTAVSPACLLNEGPPLIQDYCTRYTANPTLFIGPTPGGAVQNPKKFRLTGLYKRDKVRNQLRADQHSKCAYCEKKLAEEATHVDHFRPFTSVTSERIRLYPGYYWLGYAWENLLLTCGKCNGRKNDQFPLSNPTQRVRNHTGDLTLESPQLVDPTGENPRNHIRFKKDMPVVVKGSPKGRVTIDTLELDRRPTLINMRRERLEHLKLLLQMFRECRRYPRNAELRKLADEMLHELCEAVKPTAVFSSMAIDLLDEFLKDFQCV